MKTSAPPTGAPLWLPVVIGNIIPLIGVLFLNWSLPQIVILYWIENLILGFWNVPRIILSGSSGKLKNIPLALFFIVHYGIFCSVHGVFIMGLVNYSSGNSFSSTRSEMADYAGTGLILGALIMFISIGWDFFSSYIKNGEYKKWTQQKAMMHPYAHILVIHFAILIAGFATVALGSPLILLLALIVGKTFIELKSRQKKLTSSSKTYL
ncbi:MAG: DUF6498-containing protein [Akkermansiaceae bacterium]